MTDQHNDGGPAFPAAIGYNDLQVGMSLRDWFAGQALTGLLAGYYANPDSGGLGSEEIARFVYRQADAMIAAREASE